jgi:hypothetical protein
MKSDRSILKAIYFSLSVATLFSCEDVIHPTLQNAAPILVVDAWINDRSETQVITLSLTQPYFEGALPPPATGAVVSVIDDQGKVFAFAESSSSPGTYQWTPTAFDVLTAGAAYKLTIDFASERFEASSLMGRVPSIDSITFDTDKQLGSGDEITRAEFWATDPQGVGDAYWIRTYKNGVPLRKPSEINIAFDAGLSIGGQTDGVTFIAPVRRRINSNDEDANGARLSPIVSGDSIQVQLHSITVAAFSYLNEVGIQTDRPGGFAELFSTPLANVSTNIANTNPAGGKAVGFFNVSAVSSAGKRYKP